MSSTHLKEAMCTSLFTYWPGGEVGVCAIAQTVMYERE